MYRTLIFTAAALFATSANANQRIIVVNDVPTAHVSYADLDLRLAAGRRHMAHRIRLAAEEICVGTFVETSILEPQHNDCYVAAVASGMSQLNAIAAL